jgi:hypothetical protein
MTITAKWVGDVPASADEVFVDLGETNLALFTSVTGVLTNPAGTVVPMPGTVFTLNAVSETILVKWGPAIAFAVAGSYSLQLRLTGPLVSQRLAPEAFVVEEQDGWHTLASARDQWASASDDDTDLYELLLVARTQCLTYAPALAAGAPVPASYRKAQLMQARNLWNASKKDEGGGIGPDGFSITVFPMDWSVKNLLRPKTGIPVMF